MAATNTKPRRLRHRTDVSHLMTEDQGWIGKGRVKVMASERVVFTEENNPQQYLKVVASGEVDDSLLEALEDYVEAPMETFAN